MAEVTPKQKAEIVMLSGLNYSFEEIADEVGVSRTSVSKYLNEFEDAAKDADEWRNVYWSVVLEDVFDSDFVTSLASAFK